MAFLCIHSSSPCFLHSAQVRAALCLKQIVKHWKRRSTKRASFNKVSTRSVRKQKFMRQTESWFHGGGVWVAVAEVSEMAHKVWTSALTVCYLLWSIKKWKIEVLEFDFSLIWSKSLEIRHFMNTEKWKIIEYWIFGSWFIKIVWLNLCVWIRVRHLKKLFYV